MNRSVTGPRKQLASIELDTAFAAARQYARMSRAKSTWRAYRCDWLQFEAWCKTFGLQTLPTLPETIALCHSLSILANETRAPGRRNLPVSIPNCTKIDAGPIP